MNLYKDILAQLQKGGWVFLYTQRPQNYRKQR
jgi:predicted methyltransferase